MMDLTIDLESEKDWSQILTKTKGVWIGASPAFHHFHLMFSLVQSLSRVRLFATHELHHA